MKGIGILGLAAALGLAAGCTTSLEAAYWTPDFESVQTSSTTTLTGTPLDLDRDLGMAMDEQIVVGGIAGEDGRNRVRVDYWKITGTGQRQLAQDENFNGTTFWQDDVVTSEMELEVAGLYYEPALIKTGKFRLRVAIGANLVRFRMRLFDETTLAEEVVTVPEPGEEPISGVQYMPVPLAGVGLEVAMGPWSKLLARAEVFDASYLGIDSGFDGTFTNGTVGILIGKWTGARVLLGYRVFKAEYSYEDEEGDSTLEGLLGALEIRF